MVPKLPRAPLSFKTVLGAFSNRHSPKGPPLAHTCPLSVNSHPCQKEFLGGMEIQNGLRGDLCLIFPAFPLFLKNSSTSDRSASKSGHVGAGPGQGSPRPEGLAPRSHLSTWGVPGQPWFPGFLPRVAAKSRADLLQPVPNTATGKGQLPAPLLV